ncbi:MAG: hypothetical protein IJR87_12970 [Bacteroidaceae bacterium]|nr:hypothetical protein [Bacteroidaceae bacterium]
MKQMKNILGSRLMTAAAMTLGLAMTACQSDNEVADAPQTGAKGTPCEVPATIAADTRATTFTEAGGTISDVKTVFNATDIIYVKKSTVDGGHLTPTTDGAESTTLAGTLTGTYTTTGSGMELLMSPTAIADLANIKYDDQNGTKESMLAHDYAMASVSISQVSPTIKTTGAEFKPMQAMFRMKLQLKDGDADLTSTATDATLTIDNTHTLDIGYDFSSDTWTGNDGIITFTGINLGTSNGEVYLALPVGNAYSSESRFDITVTAGGKTFRGYKDKTGSGFVNGNFYNMSGTLTLSSKVMPTMTNHNSNTPSYSSTYSYYYWNTSTGAADVTIGGASLGYGFDFSSGGKVTLSMVNANTSGGPSNFIRVFNEDLEVNLEGDNYLICPGNGYCIYNGDNNVILGTTSTTPTTLVLRSTGNGNARKGFHTAANVVAATGCTVTPPADDAYVDNGDGTYTWTWTVVKD